MVATLRFQFTTEEICNKYGSNNNTTRYVLAEIKPVLLGCLVLLLVMHVVIVEAREVMVWSSRLECGVGISTE